MGRRRKVIEVEWAKCKNPCPNCKTHCQDEQCMRESKAVKMFEILNVAGPRRARSGIATNIRTEGAGQLPYPVRRA